MSAAYEPAVDADVQPPTVLDLHVVLVAGATVAGAAVGGWKVAAVAAVVVLALVVIPFDGRGNVREATAGTPNPLDGRGNGRHPESGAPIRSASRRRRAAGIAAACLVAGLLGGARSDAAWRDVSPRELGDHTGWVEVIGDPTPFGRATRATLEIEGQRFDAWVYGRHARRLAQREDGDRVLVAGERRAHRPDDARRAQVRHVVGRFVVDDVATSAAPGSALDRASGRVRARLRESASTVMADDVAALFTGLVIGDDRLQPPEMIDRFRATGMSHLTAVSGQNVAFVLAAASPLLRRMRPWWRWLASIAVVGWFMALTRFEPSILRAGTMAMLACTGFVLGRPQPAIRALAVAVAALVVIDPLLVWSIGFWLSVGATAGVAVIGPPLSSALPGPAWLRSPAAVTVAAQAGVALPSLVVFGRLPLTAIVANVVAVPVAGFVMLVGMPTGMLAAALPGPLDVLVMSPAALGTRWVDLVARVADRCEPPQPLGALGWVVVVGAITARVVRHRRRSELVPPVAT